MPARGERSSARALATEPGIGLSGAGETGRAEADEFDGAVCASPSSRRYQQRRFEGCSMRKYQWLPSGVSFFGAGRHSSAAGAGVALREAVRGTPAQRQAMTADKNFAVRFGMVCCSGDDTVRVAGQISAKTISAKTISAKTISAKTISPKTWVAMRRN